MSILLFFGGPPPSVWDMTAAWVTDGELAVALDATTWNMVADWITDGDVDVALDPTVWRMASTAWVTDGELAVVAGASTDMLAIWTTTGTFGVRVPPIVGKKRIELVAADASTLGSLPNAVVGPITFGVNRWEEWSFDMPADDPKAHLVLDQRIREAQVWRGDQLLSWGPMVRPQVNGARLTVSGKGARWHLSRRHVGKANRDNRLTNPGFEDGLAGWGFLRTITSDRDYQPLLVNSVAAATMGFADPRFGNRMLQIASAFDPDTFDGAVFGWQEFAVDGGDRGIVATLAGWVYVASAAYTGPPPEGHSLVLARFESDFLTNNYWTQGGGPNTWGGRRAYYTERIESSYALIDDQFQFDRWVRQETTLLIPPGWQGILQAKVWGVNGHTYYDGLSLTYDDALELIDTDQAAIVAGLVAHAQDPTYEKNDVNISTEGEATGVVRDLVALHSDHQNIWDLILGYTDLRDGMDVGMRYTPTERILTTHYPRKGVERRGLHLQLRRNIAAFTWTFDGEAAASSVIVLGTGDGSDREEAAQIDTTAFADGLILETVIAVGPEVPVDLLSELADEALAVAIDGEVLQITTYPHDPDHPERDLIGRLWEGDIVPVTLRLGPRHDETGAIVGWEFERDADYRVVELTINPDDSMALTLNRRAAP